MAGSKRQKEAKASAKAAAATAQKRAKLEKRLAKHRKKLAKRATKVAKTEAALHALISPPSPAAVEAPMAPGGSEPGPKKEPAELHVSPLAPATFPALPPIPGVEMAAVEANVRYEGRLDVALFRVSGREGGPPPAMAGVVTRSETRSAPVRWCQDILARAAETPAPREIGLLVNAGNSNAFTGAPGQATVEKTAAAAAKALGGADIPVFVASTGVIGEPLPAPRITSKLKALAKGLAPDAWEPASQAILTTDTFPKGASAVVEIDGEPVTVAGIAKGSGMIAPDMATMLVFVFTDAAITSRALQRLTEDLNEESFNAITVDGDMSTSDTLLLLSSGRADHRLITSGRSAGYAALKGAVETVFLDLAQQVVRDGEGATKFIEIEVAGAASPRAARQIGLAIANSPLVKTAFAGEDPNWGRVVMAVGKSGEAADRDRLSIHFGPHLVAEKGWRAASYDEATLAAYMKSQELKVRVDVGVGDGAGRVWTCDLTHGYISINADYRS